MNDEKSNKEVINLINDLSWPLNSEVVGREIVNEKTPNKRMYVCLLYTSDAADE